jgi:hypothetical protein
MPTGRLSLAAEVLLLAVDPSHGGLLVRRGPLRGALEQARALEGGGERGAYRAARRELVRAGVIELSGLWRTPRIANRTAAKQHFSRMIERVETREPLPERDLQLLGVLAAAGVLDARLNTHQRSRAGRKLRDEKPDWVAPLSGQTGITDSARGGHGFG